MKNYEIKVNVGYEKNIFFKENNELNITDNIDELSMYPVNIELRTFDEEKSGELIATIYGYYFDLNYMINEGIPLFEIFDSITQEIYELYEVIFKDNDYKEEYEVFNPNMFYLSDIVVEHQFRKKGYSKMLINKLDEIINYVAKLNTGVIVTQLYSIDAVDNINDPFLTKEEKIAIIKKIRKIFLDNDYKVSSSNANYLVKSSKLSLRK